MNPSTRRQLARAGKFLILLALLASTSVITRADQGSAAPATEPQPRVYLPLLLGGGGATTPNNPITVHFVDDTSRAAHYELKSEVILRAANSTRATGTAPLQWVDFHRVGTSPCSYITQGSPSTFNVAVSLTPVSLTSPAVNVNLRYNPGKPIEHVTMQCPGGTIPLPPSTDWSTFFTNLHQYEWENEGVNATVQIVNVGSFTGWVYHNTGGPDNGIVEDTQIDLAHAPER